MPSAAPTRILVTGAGTGRANNLIRSLLANPHAFEVSGCHVDPFMLAKSEAPRNFRSPPVSDARFVTASNPIIESQGIDLIVPSSDDDALSIAKVCDDLSCRTLLPTVEEIEQCQDKLCLTETLRDNNLATPETFPVQSRQDVANVIRRLDHPPLLWCRTRSGAGSRGATKVRDTDQTWAWISYWHEMRGIPLVEFTLSEYLPGRDFNVQGLWKDGELLLIKMCERLSYLDGENRPSGMSSTPALAKTIRVPEVLELCQVAVETVAPNATGVFNLDLKEDANGRACITEINAGRFAMITNIYDLTGRHNMAQSYVRLAMDQPIDVQEPWDVVDDFYLVRDYDTLPLVVSSDELEIFYGSNMSMNATLLDKALD